MSQSTLIKCKLCDRECLYPSEELSEELSEEPSKNYWFTVEGGLTKVYYFDELGFSKTCLLGVFNINHKKVICGLCDANDNKVIERPLDSSCMNLAEFLAKYGQEIRQDENV
jgi:hypothetical protein